jgi:membrane-associated phospholipid phosphatase
VPVILKYGLIPIIFSFFLIIASYLYLDKPLLFFAYHHHLRQYAILDYITRLALVFAALPVLIYPYLVVRFSYRKSFIFFEEFLLVFSNSIAISFFLKSMLKLICSRYWPMTWDGNFSLIDNNVYGFNWLQFSNLNNSFPSGHASVIFSALTVVVLFFRKSAWVVFPVASCVALALVAEYYHFLSDVIAGAALGWMVAYYVVKITKEKI